MIRLSTSAGEKSDARPTDVCALRRLTNLSELSTRWIVAKAGGFAKVESGLRRHWHDGLWSAVVRVLYLR